MIQMSLPRRTVTCIAAMLIAAIAQADGRASPGPQARHVHGSAQLNLVMDGRLVHIELISPTVNLVGFEHAPVSEAEQAAHRNALSTLGDAERLFRFDRAADCRAQQIEIAPEATLTEQAAGQDAHHHHEDGDDEPSKMHHTDITATYQFICDAPESPATLRVGLFDAFPAIDALAVQYITDSKQGGTILSSGEPVLTF